MQDDDRGDAKQPRLHDKHRRAESGDSYVAPPTAREWRAGQRPHGGTERDGPAEYGYGESNPHGAQYEEGGQYPGKRPPRDPYYCQKDLGHDAADAYPSGPPRAASVNDSLSGADAGSSGRTDDYVREALCERLRESGLAVRDVEVGVRHAIATLMGSVPDHETRAAIGDCAKACAGVRSVENKIQVASLNDAVVDSTDTGALEDGRWPSGAGIPGRAATDADAPGVEVMAAGRLEGHAVYNSQGEKLGTIQSVMLDVHKGCVAYAVLSRGGLLYIGNTLYAVPWSALTLDAPRQRFLLEVSAEKLSADHGFDKNHWPPMADESWARRTHAYYNQTPYW